VGVWWGGGVTCNLRKTIFSTALEHILDLSATGDQHECTIPTYLGEEKLKLHSTRSAIKKEGVQQEELKRSDWGKKRNQARFRERRANQGGEKGDVTSLKVSSLMNNNPGGMCLGGV